MIFVFSLGGAYLFWNLSETQKNIAWHLINFLKLTGLPMITHSLAGNISLVALTNSIMVGIRQKYHLGNFYFGLGFLPVIIPFWIFQIIQKGAALRVFIASVLNQLGLRLSEIE